jgi:hypothetical protein
VEQETTGTQVAQRNHSANIGKIFGGVGDIEERNLSVGAKPLHRRAGMFSPTFF